VREMRAAGAGASHGGAPPLMLRASSSLDSAGQGRLLVPRAISSKLVEPAVLRRWQALSPSSMVIALRHVSRDDVPRSVALI